MLRIGGLQKFSLIDYPGEVAAIVFTQGCDFRCPFCHNGDLVLPEKFTDPISEESILEFLQKRQGQLTGVVITGGEPTIQKDLGVFLRKIKDLGYKIKLDTNGNNPKALKELIDQGLVDYIAMDIKAPLKKYNETTGVEIDTKKIQESINFIMKGNIEYQFRTTVLKAFLAEEDLAQISALIRGARCYNLQKFTYQEAVLDTSLLDKPDYSVAEFEDFCQKFVKNS